MRFLIVILFMGLLSSCTDKNKVYDNIYHGMYNGANQIQEMKNPEPVSPPGQERLTYEQYKQEREEMLKDRNRLPTQ